MFRITRAFENNSTEIYRIEGRIPEQLLESWEDEMKKLGTSGPRQVILDFSQTWHVCPRAIDALAQGAGRECLFLNCSIELRNMLLTAGCGSRVLG